MSKKQGPPAESPIEPPEGIIPPHWHYATGLIGYGADGSDNNFPSVADVFDLAAELAQELGSWEEFLQEGMGICAEHDDAQSLLEEYRRLGRVEDVAIYLSNIARQRKSAFWADKQDRLGRNVLAHIEDVFPLVISHNSHLEVWQCMAGQACEHWGEEQ